MLDHEIRIYKLDGLALAQSEPVCLDCYKCYGAFVSRTDLGLFQNALAMSNFFSDVRGGSRKKLTGFQPLTRKLQKKVKH